MKNKYLERELKQSVLDIPGHEIFENVGEEDLEKIEEKIKHYPFTNLVIDFDIQKINNSKLLNMYPFGSKESIKIWDRLVAIKILKRIDKNRDNTYLEEQEEFIYNATEEEYKEVMFANSNAGIGSNGVKLLMSITNTAYRLYFIIKECKNKALYNAVSSYLDDKVNDTVVCCEGSFICKVKQDEYIEEQWLWDIYDYKIFDGFNEGKESSKLRKEKSTTR